MAISLQQVLDKIDNLKKVIEVSNDVKDYLGDGGEDVDLSDLPINKALSLLYLFNSQSKAGTIENIIIKADNGKRIPASEDRGDYYVEEDDKYVELKTSTTNNDMKLNIRQIRPWQKVDYYLCSFINELNPSQSKFYLLTKRQMNAEIKKIGSASHGTKKANERNSNIEYGITIDIYNPKDVHAKRWDKKYLSQDYYDKILG